MDLGVIVIAIICIFGFMVFLNLLESYLSQVFAVDSERESGLYQGGETIDSKERRYRAENFNLTVYFMILHVIGFLAATLYVLQKNGINPVNWATIGFGAIIFYSVFLVAKTERVIK